MFAEFIKERQYLQNVSPRTLQWYRESFKWLNNPTPSQSDLKTFVIRMREKGLKPSSCNNRIRAVNAYLQWSGSDLRVPKLKEEHRVLPTFNLTDIQTFMAWKPKTHCERRLKAIVLTLADTGTRIDEVLSLKWSDVDFDNLLLTVTGKGNKQRKIPFSFELRRTLWNYQTARRLSGSTSSARRQDANTMLTRRTGCGTSVQMANSRTHESSANGALTAGSGRSPIQAANSQLLFTTRIGKKLGRRDVLRDVKRICRRLGITPPERTLHAFRHTFAVNYLRRGGSVFHLQKCLGHSSLDMTRRYANLNVEDLQRVHQQVSLLSA